MPPPSQSQPVACTLTSKQLAERRIEWSDLRDLAASTTRVEGGVSSLFPGHLTDAVTDLAERESDCCGSWLRCAVERVDDDTVRLTLTTSNPDGLAMIESMAGIAER